MIHPFRGIRYTPQAGRASDLVTPPYDKIGASDLPGLRTRSPWCAVHLIRGESGPDDTSWHPESRKRFDAWMGEGILAADPGPGFYVLRQEFSDHAGARRVRTAVLGALDLRRRDDVLPHERTHARAREDRFRLLEATGVHYEVIFLLKSCGGALARAIGAEEPLAAVAGLEGATHRFGIVRDRDRAATLAAALADGPYVIADGHHRFAVACRHADLHPEAARALVGVVDVDDPGLVILPTHRLLRGVGSDRVAALLAGLPATPFEAGERPWEAVAAAGPGTIGLVAAGGRTARLWRPATAGLPPEEALDVAAVERSILRPLLQGLEVEDHIDYHRDPRPALAAVRSGAADLLVLVAPIPPATVIEVASRRAVMPQKSTDFYPKLPTGFVFLA